jgi:maltooligosyltrehalose trehalohydrolase
MENRFLSQGAEIQGDGVSYRTWATAKKSVAVTIFNQEGRILREIPMDFRRTRYYQAFDPESGPGTLYKYRLDGQLVPDIASRFQPHGVHGPSQVVDAHSFSWTDLGWKPPQVSELVIYELHVGTFTRDGMFTAIASQFDHLKRIGINAIELLPIADFAGNRNWGYDCVSIYAPSRAYGNPDDLRTLVNAAHQAGLAVILDVVYNHLGPDGNYMGVYSKRYFNKRHQTPWGAAFNLDSPRVMPVRKFFVENPLYWVKEFHIDGFRLDATHAIHDASPKHLIQEITENAQAMGAFVICEDARNERKILLPRNEGGYGCDAVWADDFHHVVRVQITNENEGYMGYFKGTIEELSKTLREGWLFTGELQKDGIRRGTTGADIEPEHFIHCISNHDQVGNRAFGERLNQSVSPEAYRAASALLLTTPYTPMLFMGQEWAASTPFLYFTDHHEELGRGVREGRRKEFAEFSAFRDPEQRALIPDPQALSTFTDCKLKWEEPAHAPYLQTLHLYRDFVQLRKTDLIDRKRGRWEVGQIAGRAMAIRYRRDSGGDILIVFQLVPGETVVEFGDAVLRPEKGQVWTCVVSTNDAVYGGKGRASFDRASNCLTLTEPELIVLRAETT